MNYETLTVRLWLKREDSSRVKECILLARDRGEIWLSFQLHDILTDDTWVSNEMVLNLIRSSLLRVDWLILARELLA